MTSLVRLALLTVVAAAALVQSGCYSCTTNLVWALQVRVFHADGSRAPDATLAYTVDGMPAGDSQDNYDALAFTWSIGAEREGRYHVTATEGARSVSGDATISADACHVMPMMMTLTLPP